MTSTARRAADLVLVVGTAPLWAPILGACALAVLVTSGRPVFFRQERVGRDGAHFRLLKFRTMRVGDNPLVPDPSVITPVGATLRRWSLDELPQLLNVLRGHMSLVGPRPMLPAQAARLRPAQRARHRVRPGLTGLAQVSGRNAIPWDERLAHDAAWAADPSVRRYLAILGRTARVVLDVDGTAGHDATDRFVDLRAPDVVIAEATPTQEVAR